MQTTTKFYVGIDVSKQWFDASILPVVNHQKQVMKTERFLNTKEGLLLFKKWLESNTDFSVSNCLIVIENTGVYHRLIWQFCSIQNFALHIGNAAHIKWSLGITRGKNDVVDSQRLCSYCYKNADELQATPALKPELLQLKDLHTLRSQLLQQKNTTKNYLKELKASKETSSFKQMERLTKDALAGLEASLKKVVLAMQNIVTNDTELKTNYDLLLTVPGIGKITAIYLLCCTNNFSGKLSGKQLSSYAGVVPFGHSSGSSIKGRNRVHKMSNKELKALLHLCALTCIKYYPEFKQYYDRKKAEGKNGLSVINAIKNKIVLRVVAVINSKQPYVDNHKIAA